MKTKRIKGATRFYPGCLTGVEGYYVMRQRPSEQTGTPIAGPYALKAAQQESAKRRQRENKAVLTARINQFKETAS